MSYCLNMKNNDFIKWEEISAYVHGEDEMGEKNNAFFSKGDIDLDEVHKIYNIRHKVKTIEQLSLVDDAWLKIKPRLNPSIRWKEILRYVALVFFCLFTGALGYHMLQDNSRESELKYATIHSPYGQITNLTLFDGTKVSLNSGTTLKYASNYSEKDRSVILEGEALFEVVKDKERPFVVTAGESKIKVHGTVFEVKAYPADPFVETVLVEGKVEFLDKNRSVFLEPGERLKLTKKTNQLKKDLVNAAEYTAWVGGQIYFYEESLKDLIIRLERWYEVSFEFEDDQIGEITFTGVINKEKSLDYILDVIELTNKVVFEKNENKIIVRSAKKNRKVR